LREEPSGVAETRAAYLYQQAPTRNRQLVEDLHEMYDGCCQLCGWDPTDIYGKRLCQGHHIHWLSRGGDDKLTNLLLVCPNHHAAIHACDAQLDYLGYSFDFEGRVERLTLNRHL
jgi:predicted restriction endonuclease